MATPTTPPCVDGGAAGTDGTPVVGEATGTVGANAAWRCADCCAATCCCSCCCSAACRAASAAFSCAISPSIEPSSCLRWPSCDSTEARAALRCATTCSCSACACCRKCCRCCT